MSWGAAHTAPQMSWGATHTAPQMSCGAAHAAPQMSWGAAHAAPQMSWGAANAAPPRNLSSLSRLVTTTTRNSRNRHPFAPSGSTGSRPYRHLEISVAILGGVIFWCLDVIQTKEKRKFPNLFLPRYRNEHLQKTDCLFTFFLLKSSTKWPIEGKLITFC